MDIIKWRKSYETGIDSMDLQHKRLIELINTLYKMIRHKESMDSIVNVLKEMNKYAEEHLKDEELHLKNSEYVEYDTHLELHQKYRNQIKALMDRSMNQDKKMINETYSFLRKWWMEHIVSEDKKYGEFLKSKGIN